MPSNSLRKCGACQTRVTRRDGTARSAASLARAECTGRVNGRVNDSARGIGFLESCECMPFGCAH